jgi:DNA-binding MarR family transcriptional regulator
MTTNFSEAQKTKLKEIVTEGIQVHTEIDTLREALSDTVKSMADEFGIKPATLNKAIRIAHKADLAEKQEALSEVEDILVAVGRNF